MDSSIVERDFVQIFTKQLINFANRKIDYNENLLEE